MHLSSLPTSAGNPVTLLPDADVCKARQVPHSRPARVLLVDDDPINLEIALTMLEGYELNIECAENGRVALDRLACEAFDIVLMDCQMPVMSGFLAATAIRQSAESETPLRVPNDIPVIALTANALPGDRDRCLSAGFSDYLSKPFSDAELHQKLQQWLTDRAPPPGRRDISATDPAGQEKRTLQARQPRARSLCEDVLERLISLQSTSFPGLLGRLCEAYISSVPHNLQKLRNALQQRDAAEVRATAHALKSGHTHFGALRAAELFRLIEQAASTDQLSRAQILMTEVESSVQLAMDDILHLRMLQEKEKTDASN